MIAQGNNAGYGDIRPFEEVSTEDFKRLVDTCFYGVVNVTRAALPVMRRQRSGHIIQISSLGGRTAWAGGAAYHAAKWAVGGFTEAVAQEAAPFGVLVTALEPGSMRTNWGRRASQNRPAIHADYEPSVGAVLRALEGLWGNETSDPDRVAQAVLGVAGSGKLPPHILLGSDAAALAQQGEAARTADALRWHRVTASVDANLTTPVSPAPIE